ncbi:PIGV mannosyltransferase, partial [Amia calva]|nr:PIGV mannosyltransferase [Amia calva]
QLLRGTPWGVCRGLRYAGIAVCFLLKAALGSSAILLPFGLFQYYGYRTFCTPTIGPEQISPALLELAELKGYRIPDTTKAPPAWCQWPFPVLYSYIQDVYWDVGFLRYFQLKQLPNFLLALPVTVLGGTAAWQYFRADPWLCLQLGLLGEPLRKRGRAEGDRPAAGFRHPRVFVYVVHASVLLVFGGLWMHVQVLTRFLASSSPVLYWYCAHLLDKNEPWLRAPRDGGCEGECAAPGRPCVRCRTGAVWKGLPRNPLTRLLCHWGACSPVSRCVLGYFTSYWLLGLALHCNFLPWT